MTFDLTAATPQQIVDRVAERFRDGAGCCYVYGTGGRCAYYDPDTGNTCAVGCLLPDPAEYEHVTGGVELLREDARLNGDYDLGDALATHHPLLRRLQDIHDDTMLWGKDGCLNAAGEAEFQYACESRGLVYPAKKES